MLKSKVLNIPIELMDFVFKNDIRKPFRLFLYLKANSDGKLHKDSDVFLKAKVNLDIKDIRTWNKYLTILHRENWIGFNPATGIIFIRSFNFIRQKHSFSRHRMAQCNVEIDLKDTDAFMFGAIIGDQIKLQIAAREYKKRKDGESATKKRDVANQNLSSSSFPDYLGLSNKAMGSILRLSPTRTIEIKNRAIKAGYLKCNHKFLDLFPLTKPNLQIKHQIRNGLPEMANKIRIDTRRINGKKRIVVLAQLHNEIIPLMKWKHVRLREKTQRHFISQLDGTKSNNFESYNQLKTENIPF